MPVYKHPGIYVEETSGGARPIDGVSTSVVAFVGEAVRGPIGEPARVSSFGEYADRFGPVASTNDAMGLAVMAFYLNGGRVAWICRLASGSPRCASVDLHGTATGTSASRLLRVTASSPGSWANGYVVAIRNATASTLTFDLTVGKRDSDGALQPEEHFAGLSMDASSDDYVGVRIDQSSALITVEVADGSPEDAVPSNTEPNGVRLDGSQSGVAGTPNATDYTHFYDNTLRHTRDVSIIVLPGQAWPEDGSGNAAVSATRAHCESTRNRMLIIDPASATEMDAARLSTMSLPGSSYAALYYPWVEMANPLYGPDSNPPADKTVAVAPSALAAATWAKTDARHGVWRAPAGVDTRLTGASGLVYDVSDLEQDRLNPLGVNCIREFARFGCVLWGSRTLAGQTAPQWRYIHVRRTAIFIEQSIREGIQWAAFEPNGPPLWDELRTNIRSFMDELFRAGAFRGSTPKQAYFVGCGLGETMTQRDIDRGQVLALVGFAPVKPAEFLIIEVQQQVAQG